MAPALVHFLGGAAILLALATPIAFADGRARRAGLWLVVAGGLWGLLPDLHHVAPVARGELRAFHDSLAANGCAFHYTLDSPAVRERTLASLAGSIAAFCLVVALFELAGRTQPERSRVVRGIVSGMGVAIGALLAATVFGGMLSATDRVAAAAALVGRDGTLSGTAVLLGASVADSVAVAVFVPDRYARRPVAAAAFELLLGLAAWTAGIGLALPIWAQIALEAGLPVPFVDWPSLLALASAGTLVGACVATVRRLVARACRETPSWEGGR